MKGNLKSQVRNRAHSQGLWGYCIRKVDMAPLKMKGIAPRTQAYRLKFKDIEAVVSDAPINHLQGKR